MSMIVGEVDSVMFAAGGVDADEDIMEAFRNIVFPLIRPFGIVLVLKLFPSVRILTNQFNHLVQIELGRSRHIFPFLKTTPWRRRQHTKQFQTVEVPFSLVIVC